LKLTSSVLGTMLLLVVAPFAQVLTTQKDLSSKMPNGTTFSAIADDGRLFEGHVITKHADHFLKRGSMQLVIPGYVITEVADVSDPEHVVKGRKLRTFVGIGVAVGAGFAMDDFIVDPILIGEDAGKNPAYYLLDAGVVAVTAWAQKGAEAKLPKGTKIRVESRANEP
jgi:hypothetical protein